MNKYTIEILADSPPTFAVGDNIFGATVIAIKDNEPTMVSVAWLHNKTGLGRSTILNRLANIAQGTNGKKLYPRQQAIELLSHKKPRVGRKRLN